MVKRREREATPSEPGFTELTALMAEVNEKYGNQTMCVGNRLGGYNHIETGIFTLDLALVGGFADGFPHTLFGYESCIAYDQRIGCMLIDEGGKVCSRQITMEDLYAQFHESAGHESADQHLLCIFGINENNVVIRNEVVDVVDTGVKFVYRITTLSGYSLVATNDHKIFNGVSYTRLGDLAVGDSVMVHRGVTALKEKGSRYVVVPDTIVSISYVGTQQTYDIKCYYPYNNYIVEGIVTHNSGKTTMAMKVAASAQHKYPNKAVVYLDSEGSYDTNWAEHHGVDNSRLFYVQPSTGEEAVNIAHGVLHSEETSLLVLDSLPALAPQEEVDAAVEDKFYALRSQLIARFCQKVIRAKNLHRANGRIPPTVVMINQWRTKIGFVLGDPRKLPGGDQPKYLCHSMVEVKSREQVGKGEAGIDIATHNDHSFIIKKSKAANSLREGSFTMIRDPDHWLGAGAIDDASTVVTFAKKLGLWTGAGQSQYLMSTGDHKFTSMRAGAAYLQENPDELTRAKQMLIMRQRIASNLSPVPADGYLMGAVADDLIAIVQEAAR